jgi:hypothetical protein
MPLVDVTVKSFGDPGAKAESQIQPQQVNAI